MKNRCKWDCVYPNPSEISRQKYYDYQIDGDIVLVDGDGEVFDYTIEQFKEFFVPEAGNFEFPTKVVKGTKPTPITSEE